MRKGVGAGLAPPVPRGRPTVQEPQATPLRDCGAVGRDGREMPPEAEIPGSGTPEDDKRGGLGMIRLRRMVVAGRQ